MGRLRFIILFLTCILSVQPGAWAQDDGMDDGGFGDDWGPEDPMMPRPGMGVPPGSIPPPGSNIPGAPLNSALPNNPGNPTIGGGNMDPGLNPPATSNYDAGGFGGGGYGDFGGGQGGQGNANVQFHMTGQKLKSIRRHNLKQLLNEAAEWKTPEPIPNTRKY